MQSLIVYLHYSSTKWQQPTMKLIIQDDAQTRNKIKPWHKNSKETKQAQDKQKKPHFTRQEETAGQKYHPVSGIPQLNAHLLSPQKVPYPWPKAPFSLHSHLLGAGEEEKKEIFSINKQEH